MRSLTRHLTYANIVATLCLLLLVGGGTAFALSVNSHDIVDNSILSRDVHNGALKVSDLNTSALASLRNVQITYVQGAFQTLPPGTQQSGQADCPAGWYPVGGGANVYGGLDDHTELNGSFPVDSPDADTIPDRWKVWANNPSASTHGIEPYAICLKGSTVTILP